MIPAGTKPRCQCAKSIASVLGLLPKLTTSRLDCSPPDNPNLPPWLSSQWRIYPPDFTSRSFESGHLCLILAAYSAGSMRYSIDSSRFGGLDGLMKNVLISVGLLGQKEGGKAVYSQCKSNSRKPRIEIRYGQERIGADLQADRFRAWRID